VTKRRNCAIANRSHSVSYNSHSTFVLDCVHFNMVYFWDTDNESVYSSWIDLQGPSRSLAIAQFNRRRITIYIT